MSFWKPGKAAPAKPPASIATPKKDKTDGSAPRSSSKSSLSGKTLGMKFMQRKKKQQEEKKLFQQRQKQEKDWQNIAAEHDEEQDNGMELQCEADRADPSLDEPMGRWSFGKFNVAVEDTREVLQKQGQFTAAEERELEEEVSDSEMVERMQTYTGLRGGDKKKKNKRKGSASTDKSRKAKRRR